MRAKPRLSYLVSICVLQFLAGTVATAAPVVHAEYFLDTDPGAGNATPLPLVEGSDLAAVLDSASIPLAGIPPGTHEVGLRVQDDEGRWSNPVLRRFTVLPGDFALAGGLDREGAANQGMEDPAYGIGRFAAAVAAEYFLDTDPGAGNATPLAVVEGADLAAVLDSTSIPLAGLLPGTHTVGLRVQDGEGQWSNPVPRRFTVLSSTLITLTEEEVASAPSALRDVPAGQQWTIWLPGTVSGDDYCTIEVGGYVLSVPGRDGESLSDLVSRILLALQSDPNLAGRITVSQAGPDLIQIEATEEGVLPEDWVSVSTGGLVASISRYGSLGSDGRKIVAAEYFLNVDPGEGEGTSLSLEVLGTDYSAIHADTAANIENLRAGHHRYGVRFRNAAGRWSAPLYRGLNSFLLFGDPDLVAPTITLSGSEEMDLPYGDPYVEPGYSASDNIDGDLTAEVVVTGTVNPLLPVAQSIRYEVADSAGNRSEVIRTVNVIDSEFPVISGTSLLTYTTPPEDTNIFAGLTGSDMGFGDLTYLIRLASGAVDWFNPGSYLLVFELEDAAGNRAEFQRIYELGPAAVFYPDYASWITQKAEVAGGVSGDALLFEADPDGDLRTNGQEWLSDTDPFNMASSLHLAYSLEGGQLVLQWSGLDRIQYWLEATAELSVWSPYTEKVNTDLGSDFEVIVDPFTYPGGKQFFRLHSEPRQPIYPVE